MSKVRLCADILPTGSRCRQFALKDKPWCHAHAQPEQRERNADGRQLVALIAQMNLLSVALTLASTVQELRERLIPPLYAQAILDAAAARLDELIGGLAAQPPAPATPVPDSNSHQKNRLQVVPMK